MSWSVDNKVILTTSSFLNILGPLISKENTPDNIDKDTVLLKAMPHFTIKARKHRCGNLSMAGIGPQDNVRIVASPANKQKYTQIENWTQVK